MPLTHSKLDHSLVRRRAQAVQDLHPHVSSNAVERAEAHAGHAAQDGGDEEDKSTADDVRYRDPPDVDEPLNLSVSVVPAYLSGVRLLPGD